MRYEINVMQGDTMHTYFTDAVKYRTIDADDMPFAVLECVPLNGHQRGGKTIFPLSRVVSVTERNDETN